MKQNHKNISEIFKFLITGGSSFVIDYLILFVFTEFFHVDYLISSGIGFTLSVIFNYLLCILWVFKTEKKKDSKVVFSFVASSLVGLILNQIILMILVEELQVHYLIAKIFATVVVLIWNFMMKKRALS